MSSSFVSNEILSISLKTSTSTPSTTTHISTLETEETMPKNKSVVVENTKQRTDTDSTMNSEESFVDADCTSVASSDSSRRSSVQFGSLTIRTYEIQLGDNPSCSNGAPISIGDRYDESDPISVATYEAYVQHTRRSKSQMVLTQARREYLLSMVAGYSLREVMEATQEAQKIKKQRRASLPNNSVLSRLHTTVTALKTRTIVKRRNSS